MTQDGKNFAAVKVGGGLKLGKILRRKPVGSGEDEKSVAGAWAARGLRTRVWRDRLIE